MEMKLFYKSLISLASGFYECPYFLEKFLGPDSTIVEALAPPGTTLDQFCTSHGSRACAVGPHTSCASFPYPS